MDSDEPRGCPSCGSLHPCLCPSPDNVDALHQAYAPNIFVPNDGVDCIPAALNYGQRIEQLEETFEADTATTFGRLVPFSTTSNTSVPANYSAEAILFQTDFDLPSSSLLDHL